MEGLIKGGLVIGAAIVGAKVVGTIENVAIEQHGAEKMEKANRSTAKWLAAITAATLMYKAVR